MCTAIRRIPEHDLTIAELRGVVGGPQLLDFLDRLQVAEKTSRWLTYVAPDADLSQLDLMSLTQVKRLVGRKVTEAEHPQAFLSVFVCTSRSSEPVIKLWAAYLGRDPAHPAQPQIFSSLEAAYDRLGLSPAAREAASQALGLSPVPPDQEKPTTACGT